MKHRQQIIIGTRASKLAMIQTEWVVARLRQQWPNLDIIIEQIRTTGDRVTHVPLTQIGGDGVFVIEIERALQERRIDLAVHSLKDLPTQQPAGLRLVIPGPREDVRDVLIYKTALLHSDIVSLLRDATLTKKPLRIGTSSLRRAAQIRTLFPSDAPVQLLPIRGNVDTRLRKLDAGDYDAIILASAGLHRLHLDEHLAQRLLYLSPEHVLPAPGQGALALEIRDEPEMRDLLAPLQDREVQATTGAERMFMRRLGAGCYLPVAAYGQHLQNTLSLQGLVISEDGQRRVYVQQHTPWNAQSTVEEAEQLGIRAAESALSQGAQEIVRSVVRDINEGQEFREVNTPGSQEYQHV